MRRAPRARIHATSTRVHVYSTHAADDDAATLTHCIRACAARSGASQDFRSANLGCGGDTNGIMQWGPGGLRVSLERQQGRLFWRNWCVNGVPINGAERAATIYDRQGCQYNVRPRCLFTHSLKHCA